MNSYWWIKSNGDAVQISFEEYCKKRSHDIKAVSGMDTYLIVEDSGNALNILKWGWIPDIPKKALKRILRNRNGEDKSRVWR